MPEIAISAPAASGFSRWSLQRLNIQGYCALSFQERRAISLGLRLTTGICLAVFLAAMTFRSPWAVAPLIPVATIAAFTPRHPADFVWQFGIRRLVGGPPLPPNPAERRFAFLVAAVTMLAIAGLLGVGWNIAAYALAASLVVACSTATFAHWCLPGTAAALVRGRLGQLWREVPAE